MINSHRELWEAIHDLRIEMERAKECPGSDSWCRGEKADQLCRRIRNMLRLRTYYDPDLMTETWTNFRKRSDLKAPLTVEVGRAFGWQCFWKGRGLGPCSEDLQLDRIVPGKRDGDYVLANCVLACGRHNGQRRDATIEEFLSPVPGVLKGSTTTARPVPEPDMYAGDEPDDAHPAMAGDGERQ